MPLAIDLGEHLTRSAVKRSKKLTSSGIIAAALSLLIGLSLSFAWNDPLQFARSGALGVIVGVFFARKRFLHLRELEHSLRKVLVDPAGALRRAIKRLHPQVKMSDQTSTKPSQEYVDEEVRRITGLIENITFRSEATIVAISTIVWGYGDAILQRLFPAHFPDNLEKLREAIEFLHQCALH